MRYLSALVLVGLFVVAVVEGAGKIIDAGQEVARVEREKVEAQFDN